MYPWGGRGRQLGWDTFGKILAKITRGTLESPLGVSPITAVVIEVLNFPLLIGMVTVIFYISNLKYRLAYCVVMYNCNEAKMLKTNKRSLYWSSQSLCDILFDIVLSGHLGSLEQLRRWKINGLFFREVIVRNTQYKNIIIILIILNSSPILMILGTCALS